VISPFINITQAHFWGQLLLYQENIKNAIKLCKYSPNLKNFKKLYTKIE